MVPAGKRSVTNTGPPRAGGVKDVTLGINPCTYITCHMTISPVSHCQTLWAYAMIAIKKYTDATEPVVDSKTYAQ